MAHTAKRTAVVILALAIAAAGTIYATAKPYQQDRILIELGLKAR